MHKNATWDIVKVCEFLLGNFLAMSLALDAEQDQGINFLWGEKRDDGLTKLVCVGEHHFSWRILPHEGHLLESDVPVAGYLYNSLLRGLFLASKTRFLRLTDHVPVRCLRPGAPDFVSPLTLRH